MTNDATDDVAPLAGRYRFLKRLPAPSRHLIWLATDTETGRPMVASLLSSARAALLSPLKGRSHAHVATLVDVLPRVRRKELPGGGVPPGDATVAVAHYVAGRSLHRRVEAGEIEVARAVQWVERLADGLAFVHEFGGAHGAVSPRSIVAARVDRSVTPLLSQLVVPPSGPYCSPERVMGGGASPEDDTWALFAVLFTVLSRRTPFSGVSRRELAMNILNAEVPRVEGMDPALHALLCRGLHQNADLRVRRAAQLRDELRRWLASHDAASGAELDAETPEPDVELAADDGIGESVVMSAADVGILPSRRTTAPATPVAIAATQHPPRAVRAAPASPGPIGAVGPLRKAAPLFVAAVLVGAAYLAARPRPRKEPPPEPHTTKSLIAAASKGLAGTSEKGAARAHAATGPETPAGTAAPATPHLAAPVATVAAPATGSAVAGIASATATDPTSPSADQSPAACVARNLPEGTFAKEPDLGFLCSEADLWLSARKMFSTVATRGAGDGLKLWAYLSRYELPALAVLRTACCPAGTPMEAATPETPCGSLTDPLVAIGKDPSAENVARYESTVDCLIQRRVRYPESWDRVAKKEAREYFDRFLEGRKH